MANDSGTQPTTGEQILPRTVEEIIKEAQRIEEDTLYSSKGHLAAAQFWSAFHLSAGIPIVVLSAIVASLTFAEHYQVVVRILAIVVTAASAGTTFLYPNERASAHLKAGNTYDALSNRARIFRTIECWQHGATEQQLTSMLKDISEEKNKLNRDCPQIPGWAYRRGRRGIQAGETSHVTDQR